jgi:diguanylate cyclase (GGDEF)-like protein
MKDKFFTLFLMVFIVSLFCSGHAFSQTLRYQTDADIKQLATDVRGRIYLTDDEINTLKSLPLLQVRIGDYPPFHFNYGGIAKGLGVEYITLISEIYKLNLDFVAMPYKDSFQSMKKKGGMAIQTGWHFNHERNEIANFSQSYVTSPYVIFKRIDSQKILGMDDLTNKKIVIEDGFALHRILEKRSPKLTLHTVKTSTEALESLSSGESEIYIGNLMVGYYLIKSLGLSNIEVTAPTQIPPNTLHIATRKDLPKLAALIDKAMSAITDEEHRVLKNHWLNTEVKGLISIRDVFRYSSLMIAIVSTFLVFIGIFSIRRLRREVKIRKLAEQSLRKARDSLEEEVKNRTSELSLAYEELKESNAKLESMSIHDSTTGISNRRKFDQALTIEWNYSTRMQRNISLIMIDIDYFKQYNDSYGHLKGDECLRTIAMILASAVTRKTDLVARYGGEEFVILLHNTNIKEATKIAEKCRRLVIEKNIIHKQSKINDHITISLGVSSIIPVSDIEPTVLIETADTLLYKAKEKGRNRVEN